ncbi:MAG: histidine kinase [Candidatus Sumerlaeia bacterium]|nr:histidine kinase [Candidatus Sumerlaeia bacterium]
MAGDGGPNRYLRIMAPNAAARVVPLPRDARLRVGRDPACEVPLDDPNISRNHIEITEKRGVVVMRDLKSLNGTRVNGAPALDAVLHVGDEIALGHHTIRLVESRLSSDHDTAMEADFPLPPSEGPYKLVHRIDLRMPDPLAVLNSTQITSLSGDPTQAARTYKKLGDAYRKIVVLMSAAARAGTVGPQEEMFDRFLATLLRCFELMSRAAVFLRDDTETAPLRLVAEDSQTRENRLGPHPSRERLLDESVRSLCAIYAVAPRMDASAADSDSGGACSMMVAPILSQGRLIGAVYAENSVRGYAFEHLDLDILALFAFHVATAMENARLLRQTDQAYERASKLFEEVTLDKTALLVELQRSEKKFRALFEQSGLAAATVSPADLSIRETNDAFARMLGYSRSELAGRRLGELAMDALLAQRLAREAGSRPPPAELPLATYGGGEVATLFDARPLAAGEEPLLLCTFADITATKRAERETLTQLSRITALGKLGEHLMATLEEPLILERVFEEAAASLPADFVYLGRWDGEAGRLKPVLARRRGPDGSWRAEACAPAAPRGALARCLEALQPARETLMPGETNRYDNALLPSEDPDDFLRDRLHAPLAASGRLLGVLSVQSRDWRAYGKPHLDFAVSLATLAALALQNARLYRSTLEQQENLRKLSVQLLSAQEDERRRISRELHDGVGQSLTALRFQIEGLKAAARSKTAEGLRSDAHEAGAMLSQVIDELRAISLDLRPTMLDDLGLEPALQWMVRQFQDRSGIRVDATIRLGGAEPPPELATNVYRIAQEALNNAQKHARASLISISIIAHDSELGVRIRDDGAGFDPALLPGWQAERGCSGLLNIKERALLSGGSFQLASTPGKGTTLTLSFPLDGGRQ